jgi:hypothetical protein
MSRVRRFFGKPKKTNVFWKPKCSMLLLEKNRKTEKPGGNGEKRRKIGILLNRTILIRVWCNWITFWHLHTKNWREFVWNLMSSKYLTFNILREYWVACCVFFYRIVTIFERIFKKPGSLGFFVFSRSVFGFRFFRSGCYRTIVFLT